MSILSASVGQGGTNQSGDVRLVQHLLNDRIGRLGGVLLVVDGKAGPKTNAAILLYQRTSGLVADGRVDPRGPTIKRLATDHLQGLAAGIIPIVVLSARKPIVPSDTTTGALAKYWEVLKGA